jgi:hypothetical protein
MKYSQEEQSVLKQFNNLSESQKTDLVVLARTVILSKSGSLTQSSLTSHLRPDPENSE